MKVFLEFNLLYCGEIMKKKTVSTFIALVALGFAHHAQAWDPLGDLQNPGRILRNVEREVGNAGRAVDKARLEAQAQSGAPAFQAWLQESRNTARNGGSSPIPGHIRSQVAGFFDEGLLNSVRYKVGDGGVFNLANLSIQYGGAGAVTLIDTIVFTNGSDASSNVVLWVHELKHVQQFRNWGVRDFAIRYLRSWNGVEGEAYAAQDQFTQWRNSQASSTPPQAPRFSNPQVAFPRPVAASACTTPHGACPMGIAIAVGSPCYCPSMYGPVWGISR